jgi:purine-binding chemotaxis protein CheW
MFTMSKPLSLSKLQSRERVRISAGEGKLFYKRERVYGKYSRKHSHSDKKSAVSDIEYSRTFIIPKTPDYIKGVINLRGEVLPVIDLSVLFYKKTSGITNSTGIIFIEQQYKNETLLVGVIIDAVEAVVDVPEDTISAAPDYSTKINAEYIKGIGKVDEKFIILLNIEKILDIDLLSSYKK